MISNKEIARRLKISENCVRNTLKTLKMTGVIQYHAGPRRLRKTTERENSLLFRQEGTNPRLSYHELTNTFNENSEKCLSSNTVRNILLTKNIGVYAVVRKPMLTASDRLTRLRWCKERIGWSFEKWKQVIFNYESNFEIMNRKSKVLVKRFKTKKYINRFVVPMLKGGSGSVFGAALVLTE